MAQSDVYVATRTAVIIHDGRRETIRRGVTRVRAGHPLLDEHPDMFEVLTVHFDVEDTRQREGEQRGAQDLKPTTADGTPEKATTPDAKKVREWAAEQGIEVSNRGKLPAEVVEAYQRAHSEA